MIGRFTGTSSSTFSPLSSFFSTPTLAFANDGMYFATGSSSLSLPCIDQHHRRDAGDRLRHRIQAEDGVVGHRQPGRDIAHAEEFVINRLAMLLDQQNGARNLAVGDLAAEKSPIRCSFCDSKCAPRKIEAAFRESRRYRRYREQRARDQRPHRAREFIAAPRPLPKILVANSCWRV